MKRMIQKTIYLASTERNGTMVLWILGNREVMYTDLQRILTASLWVQILQGKEVVFCGKKHSSVVCRTVSQAAFNSSVLI